MWLDFASSVAVNVGGRTTAGTPSFAPFQCRKLIHPKGLRAWIFSAYAPTCKCHGNASVASLQQTAAKLPHALATNLHKFVGRNGLTTPVVGTCNAQRRLEQ